MPIPSILTFALDVGESAAGSFLIENTGTGPLAYSVGTRSPTVTVSDAGAGVLGPGASTEITIDVVCEAEGDVVHHVEVEPDNGGPQLVEVQLTCTALPDPFDIEVVFPLGDLTEEQETIVRIAATQWSAMVTEGLPDLPAGPPDQVDPCFFVEPFTSEIDDVTIFVGTRELSGESAGALAQGGQFEAREIDGQPTPLTATGCVIIDRADIEWLTEDGLLFAVILHEMGHALGIGSIWERYGLLSYETDPPGASCDEVIDDDAVVFTIPPLFLGASAFVEYLALGGTAQPPVEDVENSGTTCSHWDEETFDEELMTGFLDTSSLPLSAITVASLLDLGYSADPGAADAYVIPECSPDCLAVAPGQLDLGPDVLPPPTTAIDEQGRRRPIGD